MNISDCAMLPQGGTKKKGTEFFHTNALNIDGCSALFDWQTQQ